MNSDMQIILNIGFVVIGALGSWVLRFLLQAIKDLKDAHAETAKTVHAIEILVAGQYMTRTEFTKLVDALFEKIDRLEHKLRRVETE